MTEKKCFVKISIAKAYNSPMEETIYYKAKLSADFLERWTWFFEYLRARVICKYPKWKVELTKGPTDILLGKEWHEYRRNQLVKSRIIKIKQIERTPIEDDLFGFAKTDKQEKINEVKTQLEMLENDTYTIPEFPESINIIKQYI